LEEKANTSPKKNADPVFGRQKSRVQLQWMRHDFLVVKALSYFAGARFEIFVNRLIFQKKIDLRKDALLFIHKIVKYKTQKEVLLSVRHDVPKLLGFKSSSMFIIDETGANLCAIGLDEESEKIDRENY